MIDTQSPSHLLCLIEGIALVKNEENCTAQNLKMRLEDQGYEASVAYDAAETISSQLQLAS